MFIDKVSSYDEIEVEFPDDIFQYDKETRILSHLVFPQYYLAGYDSVKIYLSKEEETISKDIIKLRFEAIKNYVMENNLIPDNFRFGIYLNHRHYREWSKYFGSIEFFYSYTVQVAGILMKFDPVRYRVQSDDNHIELIDKNNNNKLCNFNISYVSSGLSRRYISCF